MKLVKFLRNWHRWTVMSMNTIVLEFRSVDLTCIHFNGWQNSLTISLNNKNRTVLLFSVEDKTLNQVVAAKTAN